MSDVTELEKQKEDYKEMIARRDLIQKLLRSPAFKKVILEDYCTKECARYVGVAGDPALGKDERDLALEMGKAGQHFKRWLEVSIQMGNHAEDQMEELDRAIEEANQQEDN